jgi:hypothetical protein
LFGFAAVRSALHTAAAAVAMQPGEPQLSTTSSNAQHMNGAQGHSSQQQGSGSGGTHSSSAEAGVQQQVPLPPVRTGLAAGVGPDLPRSCVEWLQQVRAWYQGSTKGGGKSAVP